MRIGEHCIEPAELDLILNRDLAIAAGLQAREQTEADIVSAVSPQSAKPHSPAVALISSGGSIPVCGQGYQFVYRKTSSLLASVEED